MAVRETVVQLDFLTDVNPLRDINREMNDILRQTRVMGRAYEGLTDLSKSMMKEMNHGWRNQNESFFKFKNDLIATEFEYYKLAKASADYDGTTRDLLKTLGAIGAEHKRATDGLIANNDRMRQSMYRTIGTFANMTPQAEKNAAAIARMNNPLYNVNRAGLSVVGTLNKIANNANTARFALQQLGPHASMKDLNDEIQRLNKGLGAMPIVAIGAGLAAYFFYGAIHKAAMENKKYANSFNTMVSTLREAVQPMIDVFTMIMVPIYNFVTAMAELAVEFNEAHPTIAKVIQGIWLLVPVLTLLLLPLGLGVGLIKGYALAFGFFFKMIAPVVTFLATMSGTVWLVAAALAIGTAALIHFWKTNEGFRDAVTGAWNSIKQKAEEVFGGLSPVIDNVIAKFKQFSDAIKQAFSGDFSQLGEIFKDLIPNIIGFIVGGIPGLIIAGARFIPAIAQGITSNTSTISTVISQVFTSITNFLTTQLPKFITMGIDIISKLIQGITQALPQVVTALITIITMIVPLITTLLPTLVAAGIQILQAVINGILQALPAIVNAVLLLLNSLVNMIVLNLPLILNAGIQIIMALINGIVQILPQLITMAVDIILQIANMLIINLPMIIDAGIQILMALINGIVQVLPELITAAINLIMQIVDAIIANLPQIINAGVEIINALIDGLIQVLPVLIEAAVTLIVAIVNGIIDNLPRIIEAGNQIIDALIDGIIALTGQLLSTIKGSVIDPLIGKFEEIDLGEVGRNIIQGLIGGISSMAGAAMNAAKSVADSVKDAVTGALGIHSPSRVMFEYGGFVSEGMGLGIEDGARYVQRMAFDMAGGIPQNYSPESPTSTTTTNSSRSTTHNITVNVNGGGGSDTGVKQQVKEGITEVFEYLGLIYEPEGEY
ncbi:MULTISPECIES: hypothetical protein [Bacteria]|uniref:phage tail protein n=1 Tax=Bacteria TaxID=2 RepID=UPI0007DAEBD7